MAGYRPSSGPAVNPFDDDDDMYSNSSRSGKVTAAPGTVTTRSGTVTSRTVQMNPGIGSGFLFIYLY